MSDATGDKLRELFDRELKSLAADAGEPDKSPSGERMAALVHLASLIQSRNASLPKRRRRAPVVVLMVTLAVVSLLLFARVGTTEIELEASLDEVRFTLPLEQVLTTAMELSSLGISGLRTVQLPGPNGKSLDIKQPNGSAAAVSLASMMAGPSRGTVSLAPLVVAAGGRVSLRGSELHREYQMSITASPLQVQAALNGPVTVAASGSASRNLDFKSPNPVLGVSGPENIDLALSFATLPQAPVSPQLQVVDLSLFRVDQELGADPGLIRRVSTIRSGTLYFESLNGQEQHLRDGEELSFANSRGTLRSIELADGHIRVKFHGEVRGMAAGAGEARRSLMPNWLEWMHARHGLSLLWGSALYLIGIVGVSLRWWGIEL